MSDDVQASDGPPSGRWFDEYEVGQRFESPARTVTESDVVSFAGLSADYNPLHTDDDFAREHQFGRRIAHGTLVLSMVTGFLFRLRLFDEPAQALLGMRDWRFQRPVYIGDTVHVVLEVAEVRETTNGDSGMVVLAAQVIDQHDEIVHRGELVTLVGCRPG